MAAPIQNRFPREEFDYQTLLDTLKDYARPRDKISAMIRKGVIIRVKKGLYILGNDYRRRPFSKPLLANLIYGPSYISLDWALQYHGLIPERVEALTSVTTGRSRRFETPVGLFVYRNIPLPAFRTGMSQVETDGDNSFLIATVEKALCDKLRQDRGIQLRSRRRMHRYLIEDLRIDETALAELNARHIGRIAERYRSDKLRYLEKIVKDTRRPDKGRKP